ncbi:MAG: hypothetical protein KGV51_00985 [Moraxellaceae bacterium]|nr:hypothetical protein [Moraxellaceae bacterium]
MKFNTKYIKHFKKLIEAINMMKSTRYWSLWLVPILWALFYNLADIINAIANFN